MIIKLDKLIVNLMLSMIRNYEDARNDDVIDLDLLFDSIEKFTYLDKNIYCNTHLGLYDDYTVLLDDIKELLSAYSVIAAYKEEIDTEEVEQIKQLERTFINLLDENMMSEIDVCLSVNHDTHSYAAMPYLASRILEIFNIYKIRFSLDRKEEIFKIVTGEDRRGAMKTTHRVKRVYML